MNKKCKLTKEEEELEDYYGEFLGSFQNILIKKKKKILEKFL